MAKKEIPKMNKKLEQSFRELRDIWVREHVARRIHERLWETEGEELDRTRSNQELKILYDHQTEQIIKGNDNFRLAPRCHGDMSDPMLSPTEIDEVPQPEIVIEWN